MVHGTPLPSTSIAWLDRCSKATHNHPHAEWVFLVSCLNHLKAMEGKCCFEHTVYIWNGWSPQAVSSEFQTFRMNARLARKLKVHNESIWTVWWVRMEELTKTMTVRYIHYNYNNILYNYHILSPSCFVLCDILGPFGNTHGNSLNAQASPKSTDWCLAGLAGLASLAGLAGLAVAVSLLCEGLWLSMNIGWKHPDAWLRCVFYAL